MREGKRWDGKQYDISTQSVLAIAKQWTENMQKVWGEYGWGGVVEWGWVGIRE